MIVSTHTFTSQNNQPLYEHKFYHDLPNNIKVVVDLLKEFGTNKAVRTLDYKESTSSVDVINVWSEEDFQSFLAYAEGITGGYESWLNDFAVAQNTIGFTFTRKIETI